MVHICVSLGLKKAASKLEIFHFLINTIFFQSTQYNTVRIC